VSREGPHAALGRTVADPHPAQRCSPAPRWAVRPRNRTPERCNRGPDALAHEPAATSPRPRRPRSRDVCAGRRAQRSPDPQTGSRHRPLAGLVVPCSGHPGHRGSHQRRRVSTGGSSPQAEFSSPHPGGVRGGAGHHRREGCATVGGFAQWNAHEHVDYTYQGQQFSMTAGDMGHIAYVASVNSDGTVTLQDYNWFGGSRTYGTDTLPATAVPRYITDSAPATPSGGPPTGGSLIQVPRERLGGLTGLSPVGGVWDAVALLNTIDVPGGRSRDPRRDPRPGPGPPRARPGPAPDCADRRSTRGTPGSPARRGPRGVAVVTAEEPPDMSSGSGGSRESALAAPGGVGGSGVAGEGFGSGAGVALEGAHGSMTGPRQRAFWGPGRGRSGQARPGAPAGTQACGGAPVPAPRCTYLEHGESRRFSQKSGPRHLLGSILHLADCS